MNNKYFKSQNIDDTTMYVVSLLHEYEESINKGKPPIIDPYNEKIFMTVGDDVIEIPDDIKKKAIIKYNIIKDENLEFDDINENDDEVTETLTLILCISIIIGVMYGLGSLRKIMSKL
jgi:hypothetical protein